MIAACFLGFVALMTAVIVLLSARYRNRQFAFGLLAALCAWFIYVGALGYFGVIANTAMFPPLAVVLHVLAIRSIVSHARTAQTPPSSTSTIGDKGLR